MYKTILALLLLCVISSTSIAQNSISGKITSNDGKPVPLVTIELKETRKTLMSDEDGHYEFVNIADGNYVLTVSFVGMKPQQKALQVAGSTNLVADFSMSQSAAELEGVILTARRGLNVRPASVGKVAIDPMDLPQSVAVISQGIIREQQMQRLSDVVKNVNGVYLSTTRGSTQESFSARGYGFSSTNMFKNGSRINSGTMPEMSSLEKVEILKGSAAILYGNVSPGGIINMVTKQPKFDFGGELAMRAGSYGLIKPSFDVYGPISSNIAFRLNGTYEKADSYRDQVESKRFYINPSVLFKLSKKTELLLQGDHLDHEFTPDFGIGSLNNTRIPDVARGAFFGTAWQYNKAKQTTATATLKHQLTDNWSINTTASYQLYQRDYYSTERIQADSIGDWNRPLNKILSDEDYVIGQIDVIGKFKTGSVEHKLLTGIDADRYHTTAFTFNNPTTYDRINILDPQKFVDRTDIPAATRVTRATTPVDRIGAYAQDMISISEKLKLLAGVRWSQQASESATTTWLNKDSSSRGVAKKDQAFSPRAGLVYRPTKTVSLFASYANSFSVNSGTDIYNAALSPSIIDQYELGIKNDFFKGKLSANVTVYKIINNNLAQTAQFDRNGLPNNNTAFKELVGQTTSDGVELDLSSTPVNGLNILAGYSYNNMRFTNIKQVKGNYINGERLVNTPAHTANSSVFYTFQKNSAVKGLKLGASVFYIGDRFGGWNNTVEQAQKFSRLIKVDGFTTVDISAGYSFKKLALLAKVSNLFNTYSYYVHENYSINPIPPTQFIATVSYKF